MRSGTPRATAVSVSLIILASILIVVSLKLPAVMPRHDGWGDRDRPYSTKQVLLGLAVISLWPPLAALDGGYLLWLPLLGATLCFVISSYAAVRRAVSRQRPSGYAWAIARWGLLSIWVPLLTCAATPSSGNVLYVGYYLLAGGFTAAFLAFGDRRCPTRAPRPAHNP